MDGDADEGLAPGEDSADGAAAEVDTAAAVAMGAAAMARHLGPAITRKSTSIEAH